MIEIKWRMREFEQAMSDEVIDIDHQIIVDMINAANVSHDYSDLMDHLEESVLGVEFMIFQYPSINRAKMQDVVKKIVQSMYDNCSGLKKAVEADGAIDPDYLPT